MNWGLGAKTVLSAVLIVIAAVDLKTRRVPHVLSWPLLAIAMLYRVWVGSWVAVLFPIGLIILELAPGVLRVILPWLLIGIGSLGGHVLGLPEVQMVSFWCAIAYILWQVRIYGAGDARLFWSLLLLFPEMNAAWALTGGLLVVSLFWMLVLHRGQTLGRLREARTAMQRGEVPTREQLKSEGRPTTPGLVLGALAYIWLLLGL